MPQLTEPEVFSAIRQNDIKRLKELLRLPGNLRAKNAKGETLMRFALEYHCKNEIGIALVEAGADLSQSRNDLVWAVGTGRPDVVRAFIRAKADIHVKTYSGTPLEVAVSGGHTEVVKVLVEAGADVNAETLLSTPLETAIDQNLTDIACTLLHAGAKIDANKTPYPLILRAIAKGNVTVVQALINAGADVNGLGQPLEIDEKNACINDAATRVTPLILATKSGLIDIVRLLRDAGANPHLQDEDGYRALDWARRTQHPEIVRLLETATAQIPAPPQDPGMKLILAAERGEVDGVRALLASGVSIETRDQRTRSANMTPLMCAAATGQAGVVEALLQAGAAPDAQDRENGEDGQKEYKGLASLAGVVEAVRMVASTAKLGKTALMLASYHGHGEVVRLLLAAGAKVNLADNLGYTPLMWAALAGHSEVVEQLIKANADVQAHDICGNTAFNLASEGEHKSVVQKFHEFAVTTQQVDPAALVAAVKARDIATVKSLLAAGAGIDDVERNSDETALLAALSLPTFEMESTTVNNVVVCQRMTNMDSQPLKEKRRSMVKLLLEAGADPNRSNRNGITPLMQALESGVEEELVQSLLKAGADVNAEDREGTTVLMHIIAHERFALLPELLRAGAKVNQQNEDGETALMRLVSRTEPKELTQHRPVEQLLSAGADVNLLDSDGHTALDLLTKRYGMPKKVWEALVAAGAKSGKDLRGTNAEPEEDDAEVEPDFSQAARNPKFKEAVRQLATLCGCQPQLAHIPGVFHLHVHSSKKLDLEEVQRKFLAQGCYVCSSDGLHQDNLYIFPTTDKYQVIAAMGTNGANYELGNADVIRWLKKLEAEQPFILTAIGSDVLSGKFTTPIQNPQSLARRMYKFCPDIVDQGCETLDVLATELAQYGRLYFWWD